MSDASRALPLRYLARVATRLEPLLVNKKKTRARVSSPAIVDRSGDVAAGEGGCEGVSRGGWLVTWQPVREVWWWDWVVRRQPVWVLSCTRCRCGDVVL